MTLELPDLHGDILATATTNETATGPLGTYTYTEFGTPENGSPGTYGWLGAGQISSNALGDQLLMGARAYNPNTGCFDQVDPIPGGSANAYDYAQQNPLTHIDPSGLYWRTANTLLMWDTLWQPGWFEKNWFTRNIANILQTISLFIWINSLSYRFGEMEVFQEWIGVTVQYKYRILYYLRTQWRVAFTVHTWAIDLFSRTWYWDIAELYYIEYYNK